jgi:hypothetical protein
VPALGASLLGVLLVVTARIGPDIAPDIPLPSISPTATVLLAVGDTGSCDGLHDDAVAELAASLPGTIALLGDLAYNDGSAYDYRNCFAPAWGPVLARIRPVPGNHDYRTADAAGYFSYFGSLAGTPGEGWYSYNVGAWHVIALNSNCDAGVGCGAGSPQLAWLKADLVAHPATCTLAYWHHARYSSGRHGDQKMTDSFWQALAAAGADLVLAGHDHDYERFGPIDGIRSFVVGTGGRSRYEMIRPPNAASELRVNSSDGLLMLTLKDSGFDWQFIPARGSSLTDHGSAQCH